jgi:hypothetical protein
VTALLLLGLLLADPPPAEPAESPDESVVRPAVPEAGLPRELRPPMWGFTAAVGIGGIMDSYRDGIVVWGGVRRWLGPSFIAGGLVSFQQFGDLNDLAVLTRFELATMRKHDRLFPSFSAYVGAGPELFTNAHGTSCGLRLAVGTHLPTICSGISGYAHELIGALFLLVPTAVELQFRTGGGAVRSSTAIVFAMAL